MSKQQPEPARVGNRLCFSVYAAAHAFNRAYRPLLEPLGLTYPQYLALLALWEEDDRTVKALGEMLYLDSGTLTPLLKRLETAGLVRRRRDEKDERLVRISLTAAGAAMRETASHVPDAIACQVGDAGEAEALRVALGGLRDRLEADQEPPAP